VPEKWVDEAQRWNEHGDPPFDPELDPRSVRTELIEKASLQRELERQSDQLYEEMFREVFGFTPPVDAELTVWFIVSAVLAKFGRDAKQILEDIFTKLKTSTGPQILPGGRVIWPRRGPVAIGKTVLRRALFIDILIAVFGGYIGAQKISKYWEITTEIGYLERAARWEALQIDPATDPETVRCEVLPSEEVRAELAGPACGLYSVVILRWIDPETGNQETQITERRRLRPSDEDNDVWVSEEYELPSGACFPEQIVQVWLICDSTPPKNQLLHEYKTPWRTSTPCESRGVIPSEASPD